ncbi:c-type cytochrome [Alcaligenaceae bacterium]|nr:c-type cytochrome [Alcaligenaceae bacterium]
MVARSLSVLLCLLSMALAPFAHAQMVGVELARAKNCLSCHQVDKKVVGPAMTVIAQRFAGGQEGAQNYLAQTIRNGGRGRWGPVPMPAQPQVSPADAQLLAAWILSLADTGPETQAKE